jgi:ubiquinone/menaquinone biosynthesis C-methylase UbiE
MRLATQYDEWHQQVLDSSPEHPDEESPWYKLVLEYLVPVDGKRVLEVACGRGGFAKLLASRGATTFGADFSYRALEIAQTRARSNGSQNAHLHFIEADAQNLPYAGNSFDIVISCETIEHLPDPFAALHEMARVCRPGGLLYLTTPNYLNAMGLYNIYARIRHRRATPGSDQPYDRVFLFPQVRDMLRKAGWEISESDGTVHQFPVWPGHDPVALPALEANRWLRRFLSPLAFHYFVLARRSHEPR